MRKLFTHNWAKQLFTLTLFSMVSVAMMAQMTLEVTSPDGIARTYEIGVANYGGNATPEISGTLVITEDGGLIPNEGCNPITNDIAGKIAVSDRGTCNFSIKAFFAQQAGAIAAILCNSDDDVFNMAAGDSASLITIPHVMLSSGNCTTIKNVMMNEDVTVRIFFANWGFDNVLWGDGADGADFDNDYTTAGWSSVGIIPDTGALWSWAEEPVTDGSCGSFRIQSPTGNNGAVFMDADGYLSGGSAYDCGTGVGPLNSEFISPVIDASGFAAVAVRFWQFNLPISISESDGEAGTAISWSLDGGTTWTNPLNVPTASEQNTSNSQYANAERYNLVIPEAAGAENFRVKLTYNRARGFYNWMVDDFALIEPPRYDPKLEGAFFTPLSFATPQNHLMTDTFGFSANVWNAGINDDATFITTVRIIDEMDNVLMEQVDMRTVPALSRDTIGFNSIAPDFPVGNYQIHYSVEMDGQTDEIPGDSETTFDFVITADIFGKELADEEDITAFSTRTEDPWYWGPFYTISSIADAADREFVSVQTAASASDGALDDESWVMYLLRWNDPNDGYPQFAGELNMPGTGPLDHPFLSIVALAAVNPAGLGQNQLFEVSIENGDWLDENGNPLTSLTLDAGATYAILNEFSGEAVGLAGVNGDNLPGAPGILQNWNGGGEYFTGFTEYYPVSRLRVSSTVAAEDIELTEVQAKVYPTITNDIINIELNFDERTETNIMITDMNGRVQTLNEVGNVAQFSMTQDVSDYAAGLYLVNIQTSAGQKQVPITVIK